MANEAREVVSGESNNLFVYFSLVHLPGKLRVQMRTLFVLLERAGPRDSGVNSSTGTSWSICWIWLGQ